MDQDHLGIFGLLLKNTYEETIHIDVVEVKRDKMLMRLDILKDACKQREYEKATFVIFDICNKVLNDSYSDEYNLKPVEIDMIVFTSAVLSITTKHYDRIKQIITGLIMKYHNPIFYFVLGISYFYDLNFQEAKKHLAIVMRLLSEHKNTKLPWPDTDVMITTVSTDKIKEYALFFLNTITPIEKMKNLHTLSTRNRKHSPEIIEISKRVEKASLKLNVGIGNCIQQDIYPYVQTILTDLIKFDISRLPVDYQKVVSNVCEPVKNEAPNEISPTKKKANVNANTSTDKSAAKKNQTIQNDPKQKKCALSEPTSLEKNIGKKNEAVQTQVITKCKQVQTGAKSVSLGIQTVEV